ncbi:MAG: Hsp20/alpha crystallin family protein [Desulfovibrionaceae bacterium]
MTNEEEVDMFARFLPALKRRAAEPEQAGRPADVFDLMSEMMRAPFAPFGTLSGSFPALDVKESETEVVVTAETPGLGIKDVDLRVEAGRLVLRGEKRRDKEDKGDNYHRVERSYGSFYRTVDLPAPVVQDKAKASFKDGVLTVRLPKDEQAKPRRVAIE